MDSGADDELYSVEETERRVQAALRGAAIVGHISYSELMRRRRASGYVPKMGRPKLPPLHPKSAEQKLPLVEMDRKKRVRYPLEKSSPMLEVSVPRHALVEAWVNRKEAPQIAADRKASRHYKPLWADEPSSSSGRTSAFEAESIGSNPVEGAKLRPRFVVHKRDWGNQK